MCDPVVCSFLTKTLCAQGGRMGLSELQQHVGLSARQLQETLQAAGPERFLQLTGDGVTPEVLALTTVRVCMRKQCDGCQRLHLCKLHLMGRCGQRYRACKYSHDITGDENKKVLKTHELSGLSESELRILLLQNDPFLLPDACKLYNDRINTCSQPSSCNNLHICRHFLHGGCKFFPCKRSHNLLDSHALRALKNGGVDEKMASNIQTILDYKHTNLFLLELYFQKGERTDVVLVVDKKDDSSANTYFSRLKISCVLTPADFTSKSLRGNQADRPLEDLDL